MWAIHQSFTKFEDFPEVRVRGKYWGQRSRSRSGPKVLDQKVCRNPRRQDKKSTQSKEGNVKPNKKLADCQVGKLKVNLNTGLFIRGWYNRFTLFQTFQPQNQAIPEFTWALSTEGLTNPPN